MIETVDKGERARAVDAAIGRLQAENTAETGRNPDRAIGVGAQGEGGEPGGHRGGRTARGAAGGAGEVVRVMRVAVMRVFSDEAKSELIHVQARRAAPRRLP